MDVEVDRLSSLPDDLVHKILSFVDIIYSIRLSVVSSRFKFVWTSMPDLNFAYYEFRGSYHEFVDKVLSRRNIRIDVSSVNLNLMSSRDDDDDVTVERILKYACSHNVQQMTIDYWSEYSAFPLSLLSSETLKHLTMISASIDCRSYSPWDLPALTTLHLQRVELHDCSPIFGTCQNLKNLTLDQCKVFESSKSSNLEPCKGWGWECEPSTSFTTNSSTLEPCFTINSFRLLNLTLKEVEWHVDFVHVDTPQLKNLILVDQKENLRYSGAKSIRDLLGGLTVSAPELTYLLVKGFYFFNLSFDGSLEKVDLCISSPQKTDVHKICDLFQRLHSVKSLALSSEIVELLSSSVEEISHQPSPFVSLKSLKIYPLTNLEIYGIQLTQEQAAKEINLSTEVKSYLLDGSPNATFTVVSRKEVKAIKTTIEAQRLMDDLWKSLEKTEGYIKTRWAYVEGENCFNGARNISSRGDKLLKIFFSVSHIKELLNKVVTSKKVELQQRYSRLCAEAETVVNKIMNDLKNQCDIKRSNFSGYFEECTSFS